MPWKPLVVTLPVLAGGLIYVAFRSEHLLMFQWFTAIGLAEPVFRFRKFAGVYRSWVPDTVVFSAPSGLWLLSYSLALSLIWPDRSRRNAVVWVALLYAIVTSSEFLQLAGILPGTFDWVDIAFCTGAALLGTFFLTSRRTCYA